MKRQTGFQDDEVTAFWVKNKRGKKSKTEMRTKKEKRTVAQVTYDEEDNGFTTLFDYISGANKNSANTEVTSPVTQPIAIKMTVPVTQSKIGSKMNMRFFLPQHFSKKTAPEPTDERVSIIDLPEEYFAVISYSGFASQSNFKKHQQKLKLALEREGLVITGSPLKATYNSPFTLPFLRRNEAMYPLKWNLSSD